MPPEETLEGPIALLTGGATGARLGAGIPEVGAATGLDAVAAAVATLGFSGGGIDTASSVGKNDPAGGKREGCGTI